MIAECIEDACALVMRLLFAAERGTVRHLTEHELGELLNTLHMAEMLIRKYEDMEHRRRKAGWV